MFRHYSTCYGYIKFDRRFANAECLFWLTKSLTTKWYTNAAT